MSTRSYCCRKVLDPDTTFKNYKGFDEDYNYPKQIVKPKNEVTISLSLISQEKLTQQFIPINLNDPSESKFLQICESLNNDNDPIQCKIKRFILGHNVNVMVIYKYLSVLRYIYQQKLFNFTIKFDNDEKIECNKNVLMTNKYFKTLFDDCGEVSNELFLTTDYNITTELIKLLYRPKNYDFDSHDFCKIFEMMDMMLMDSEYIYDMLKFLDEYTASIINYEFSQNNINNIQLLILHLKNIYDTNNDFGEDTKVLAHHIYKKIINLNFDIKILNHDNWKMLETFNVFRISFLTGIKILKNYDFGNDIYAQIEYMTKTHRHKVYYKYSNSNSNRIKTCNLDYDYKLIIINEWYPTFKVDIFEKINCKINELHENQITIKFNGNKNPKILINSKLLFGHNVSPLNDNIYEVIKIVKCLDDRTVEVMRATSISDLPIYYKLYLNKNIPKTYEEIHDDPIWIFKQIEHKVLSFED